MRTPVILLLTVLLLSMSMVPALADAIYEPSDPFPAAPDNPYTVSRTHRLDIQDLGWICFLVIAAIVCTALLILAMKYRK